MAKTSSEVQQIDLTKLNLQQLQQLKNEFESVRNNWIELKTKNACETPTKISFLLIARTLNFI